MYKRQNADAISRTPELCGTPSEISAYSDLVAPKQRMRDVDAVEPAPSTISPSILAPTSVRATPPSTTPANIDPSNVIPAIIRAQKTDPVMQRLENWVVNKVTKPPGKMFRWNFAQQSWWNRHKQRRIAYTDYQGQKALTMDCLLYTSPSPRDYAASRMPSSA